MSKTARLKLPFIHSGQAQKEITHNEALNILDILINPVVQGVGINARPAGARAGELFIIGDHPEGRFSNHAGKIAAKLDHGWQFITPPKWLQVTVDADGSRYVFNGNGWIPVGGQIAPPLNIVPQPPQANNVLISKDTGEYLKAVHLQEDVALQGAYVDTQIQIPHHSIVIAVSVRVLEAISGTESFSVGVEGATSRYGNNLNTAQDTTNLGLTDSLLTYWQNTPIRLTANNNSFTGGMVRVTIQLLKPHGAWNWD